MITAESSPAPRATQKPGRPVAGWAVATVVLFAVSLLIGLVGAGAVYASPYRDTGEVQRYFTEHQTMTRLVALLQLCSALALAGLTGALSARLRTLAPRAVAATYAATVGGAVAAALLLLNALVQWVITQDAVLGDAILVHALNYLFFALGGFGHTAALSLLVGAVGLAALRAEFLPRWLAATGPVVAVLAALSVLTMLGQAWSTLVPVGRFPALLWLLAAALSLSRDRASESGAPRAGSGRPAAR